MSAEQDYLNLITSEHKNKPNFTQMVSDDVSPMVQVQALLQSMIALFDIDTPPVGQQLDIIGQWVGVSRNLRVPIPGVFFSWDSGDSLGWEFGVWQDPANPTAVIVLPDDVYLTLIRARIAANHWDGTTEGAYKIWSILFPHLVLLIQDNQDMTFALAIQGTVPDSLTLALLTGGYLPLKPEGVGITAYFTPIDTGKLFGWDLENGYFGGWEEGSWAVETAPT